MDVVIVFIYLQIASHKQLLMRCIGGNLDYKQITDVLKAVDCLYRLTAHLPVQNTNEANLEAPEDTGRPSTSSTPANHSYGRCAAPHQVVTRPDPPPPPHASPALEIPPSPHASPSPEIPSPIANASSHPKIPPPTPSTFSDLTHLSITLPSFDLNIDFNETLPVMHIQSPLYNIGHIDHVQTSSHIGLTSAMNPPHTDSMSFMPTPGLHTDPMSTGLTHIICYTILPHSCRIFSCWK